MKKISLQWRITLMSVALIGITCVSMKLLICSSGMHYMGSIGASLQGCAVSGEPAFLTPMLWAVGRI